MKTIKVAMKSAEITLRGTSHGDEQYCYWCSQWRPRIWFDGRKCLPCQLVHPQRSAQWWQDIARMARSRGVPDVPDKRPKPLHKPRQPKPIL